MQMNRGHQNYKGCEFVLGRGLIMSESERLVQWHLWSSEEKTLDGGFRNVDLLQQATVSVHTSPTPNTCSLAPWHAAFALDGDSRTIRTD